MAHVVTENCINCKHTDCVEVCPVGAIYAEGDVPAGQEPFVAINAELAPTWPVIDKRIPALPDAAKWDGVPNKLALLIRQAVVPDPES